MSNYPRSVVEAVKIVADIVKSESFVKPDRPCKLALAYYEGKRVMSPRKPTAKDANRFTFEGAIARACSHSTSVEFQVYAVFKLFTEKRIDEWASHRTLDEIHDVADASVELVS